LGIGACETRPLIRWFEIVRGPPQADQESVSVRITRIPSCPLADVSRVIMVGIPHFDPWAGRSSSWAAVTPRSIVKFVAQPRRLTLLLFPGFCLAIAATFFFGYRAGRTARRVRWQNEPIQSWMSVPFVAHTHHTSEELLFEAIRVSPNPHDHRPIRDIAQAEKRPVGELMRDLRKVIADSDQANAKGP
jgi:hypothetical protein